MKTVRTMEANPGESFAEGKPMRKKLCAAICLLTMCVSLFGGAASEGLTGWYENEWNYMDASMDASHGIPQDASGVLRQIQRTGTLRVAVDADCAPRVFRDAAQGGDDGLAGADIRLARVIAEKMGVQLKLVKLESTQILPALSENHCDLTICGIGFTPGRALAYTMSKGYYFPENGSGIGILIPEGSEIASLEDLAGRVLTAERNSVPEAYAARHIPGYLEFRRPATVQAVYEAVQQGRADAAIVLLTQAENYLKHHPSCGLHLAEGLIFLPDEQYLGDRIAAKKGETQLIAFVNGVIDEILETGQYERWMEDARKRAAELGL